MRIPNPDDTDRPWKVDSWLRDSLFPKLVRWACNVDEDQSDLGASARMVDAESYVRTYARLKQSYAQRFCALWPEATDPHKFVHEDVAIASYLLVLWTEERRRTCSQQLQSFVDVGCGNGLLVHLLSSEGHPGRGFDVRARKIWAKYPSGTHLEVSTWDPSQGLQALSGGADWVIGNHPDELSPWIPLAASSQEPPARFILIPCCPWGLTGKFQRRESGRSRYAEYVDYLEVMSREAGFVRVERDRLRIPSTKRACILGLEVLPDRDVRCEAVSRILSSSGAGNHFQKQSGCFFSRDEGQAGQCSASHSEETSGTKTGFSHSRKRCEKNSSGESTEAPHGSFPLRPESVPLPQNMTHLDRTIVQGVVASVAQLLLERGAAEEERNYGGCVRLEEIVSVLQPEWLASMRRGCGGVQTVLRNQHHIFLVRGGTVCFRIPGEDIEGRRWRKKVKGGSDARSKQKKCWFHNCHPQGCMLSADECCYLHEPYGEVHAASK